MAAVYAARKLLSNVLVTSDTGEQVNWTNGVENYMGYQFIEGDELISKFQQQVNQFPINQKIGQKVTRIEKIEGGFEVVCESGDKFQGKVVILATGKRPRRLNVAGEMDTLWFHFLTCILTILIYSKSDSYQVKYCIY